MTLDDLNPQATNEELQLGVYIRGTVTHHVPSDTFTVLFRADGMCCSGHAKLLAELVHMTVQRFLSDMEIVNSPHESDKDLN